ncbi:hypothetical protein BJY52DRAFT_1223662 [Lactarius psammicola]|nr:hypothetical protein BJY52DRAFT_1223662 [Lactarius psammicola]
MAKWVLNGVGQRKGMREALPVFEVAVCKAIVVGVRCGLSVCKWVTNDDDSTRTLPSRKCRPHKGKKFCHGAAPIHGTLARGGDVTADMSSTDALSPGTDRHVTTGCPHSPTPTIVDTATHGDNYHFWGSNASRPSGARQQ